MLDLFIAFFLLFLSRGIEANQNDSEPFWDYGDVAGPEKWRALYPSCNGSRQSPIDLLRSEIVTATSYERINFFGYKTVVKNAYLENNGHTGK
ncbi:carbonic anhydrase 6-like [Centruroides sculpturatus]|uniref:carbonic anhydrase 6-like n=1 Tax=Centruroides sculpturatus TaxID=218467 RepID=UPI000C6D6A7B|nr:carbonic anhydrase 6-like [Centruroides sculpturatus]